MKTSTQLKAKIKNLSTEYNINSQLLLQNFMMERLIERISISNYKNRFILKGGFLIASILGVKSRSTMDIDGTIQGMNLEEKTVATMFNELCAINIEDNITFELKKISAIREDDDYSGFRVSVLAQFDSVKLTLKVDLTTGDKITPKELEHNYKLMFEDRSISIMAYNLETLLSEKIETVISRGDLSTRPRDYYDIYMIYKLYNKSINMALLKEAISETSKKRGSNTLIEDYANIIEKVEDSEAMEKHWKKYQSSYSYAINISFNDCCITVLEIMNQII